MAWVLGIGGVLGTLVFGAVVRWGPNWLTVRGDRRARRLESMAGAHGMAATVLPDLAAQRFVLLPDVQAAREYDLVRDRWEQAASALKGAALMVDKTTGDLAVRLVDEANTAMNSLNILLAVMYMPALQSAGLPELNERHAENLKTAIATLDELGAVVSGRSS